MCGVPTAVDATSTGAGAAAGRGSAGSHERVGGAEVGAQVGCLALKPLWSQPCGSKVWRTLVLLKGSMAILLIVMCVLIISNIVW